MSHQKPTCVFKTHVDYKTYTTESFVFPDKDKQQYTNKETKKQECWDTCFSFKYSILCNIATNTIGSSSIHLNPKTSIVSLFCFSTCSGCVMLKFISTNYVGELFMFNTINTPSQPLLVKTHEFVKQISIVPIIIPFFVFVVIVITSIQITPLIEFFFLLIISVPHVYLHQGLTLFITNLPKQLLVHAFLPI